MIRLFAATMLAVSIFISGMSATPAHAAPDTIASGSFKGVNGKRSSGGFEIFKDGGKTFIRLKSDFSLSSVPDPKLAFGNGSYEDGTIYAKLKSFKGEQVYEIPASLDPAKFDQVWIWCEKFSVPLAVAEINRG